MAQQEELRGRFPVITLSVTFFSLIAYSWPHLSELLVYDRQAILQGEVWRLFSAVFVHFSASHICWDLLAYGAAGCMIEAAGYGYYGLVCTLAAVIPGVVFLFASPDLIRYGGLSGLATGAVAYLCLWETNGKDKSRVLWLAILGLIGVKIIVEIATGTAIFTSADKIPFHVLPSVHAVGYATALSVFAWARAKNGWSHSNEVGTHT